MGKSPFLWGDNGAALTPAQVADRRRIAEALAGQASDTSPVGHWTAALNRGLQGYFAGKDNKSAQAAEAAGMAEADALAAGIGMGGASPVAEALARGAPSPPMASNIKGKDDFLAALAPAAIAEGQRIGVDPRIIIAQAAQETGWGRSAPNNNFFGIKSHGKPGGGTFSTTEYINGKPVTIQDSFRSFDSPEDSVRGYASFLSENPRYKPMLSAAGDFDSQVDALGKSGYATDPNYANSIRSIAASLDLSPYMGAGSGVSQAPSAPNVSGLASAMGNPWFKEQYGDVASALMDQQMQQQNAAYRQQLDQQDPRNQVALEMAQLELDRARNPVADPWAGVQEINGQLVRMGANGPEVVGDYRNPQAPEMTADQRNYEFYRQQEAAEGRAPVSFNEWGLQSRRAGAANVSVGAGETEFDKSMGKADADLLSTASTTGIAAQRNLARIDELGSLLESAPTGAAGLFAQAAGGWGIGVPGASEVQAAEALINSLVPEQRQPGSGPMSDADLALFKKSLPRIINQPDGNRRILSTMRAITSYDAQGADIAARVRLPEGDPNRLTRSQAIQALQSRPDPLASIKAERPNAGAEQSQSGYAARWTDMGNGVKIRRRE